MIESTKKQKRLARNSAKKAKVKRKNAKLIASIKLSSQKLIRSTMPPKLENNLKKTKPHDYFLNKSFTWCVRNSDVRDKWSWDEPRQWTEEEYLNLIEEKLDLRKSNTWDEVLKETYGTKTESKKVNKSQSINSLCLEAKKRWLTIYPQNQFPETFRFRASNMKRIWGIRVGSHFYVIWFERNHKICPVKSK